MVLIAVLAVLCIFALIGMKKGVIKIYYILLFF